MEQHDFDILDKRGLYPGEESFYIGVDASILTA
jgi:hypothetical protein